MIRCVVIDDEPDAIEELLEHLDKIPGMEVIASSTNPLKGLEIVRREKPDVVFLDIEMDNLNGMELKKLLPKEVKVIFCTAYSEFAPQGFELDAVDYLVKPVLFERFLAATLRLEERLGKLDRMINPVPIADDYFFLKTDYRGKREQVNLIDICYVESDGDYVKIIQESRTLLSTIRMKDLYERLKGPHFGRVHQSYIVPIRLVRRVDGGMVWIKTRKEGIPIGRAYRDDFMAKIDSKLLSREN